MPEPAPQEESRIIVTAGEVARISAEPPPGLPRPVPAAIAWWSQIIACAMALAFPLLCLIAIAIRLSVRKRERRVREAWNSLLCTLLIVSGLATFLAAAWFWTVRASGFTQAATVSVTGLQDLDTLASLPSFPSKAAMTPVELADRTKELVFIITPDGPGAAALDLAPIGAGLLLMANERGYLLGTNRHVADQPSAFRIGGRAQGHVLAISSGRHYARAEIVGRHMDLDLALLWVDRGGGNQHFRQSISPYASIPVGAAIFVIGHPQRLFFTLSNGLISRVDGTGMLQLTAPISPGNSGGPVYDPQGNLLGVVTLKIDRMFNPNAENLNFATRADAFLSESRWQFFGRGKESLESFIHGDN